MSELIESILSEDYVSASQIFESRLNDIMEMKLVEMKKMVQAESVGGLTKAEIEARRKAGYRKASEVLPDPRKDTKPIAGHEFKRVKKKKVNEVALTPADKPIKSIVNQQKDLGDRYKSALDKAKELETRGAKGQVSMVRKTYRPYRFGVAAGQTMQKVAGIGKSILQGLGEENA